MGLEYYFKIEDATLSYLLRQASNNTEKQLMVLSGFSWQDCPDNGRSTRSYIVFYQCGPINHCTYVPVIVDQSSAESYYNAECTSGMALAHLTMLNNDFLNKDTYVVPEKGPLIILYSKSYMCMAKNYKDTKHTRHISIRMHFLINGEECNLHKTVWYEGGLQLVEKPWRYWWY